MQTAAVDLPGVLGPVVGVGGEPEPAAMRMSWAWMRFVVEAATAIAASAVSTRVPGGTTSRSTRSPL
jgi:hypothetical protein